MAWPSGQDYNEAVQNPLLNFADPELKMGCVELTPLGLPRPITGGFATVYKVQCGPRIWAVRCFLGGVTDQQKRYEEISKHLAAARLPYTVGFDYQTQGIRVRGQWYPILKMEWVPGEPLNAYIEKNLTHPAALMALANRWLEMACALQKAGIAHGDLQHGNVLIVNGQLKLIDYDGMYVPALQGFKSHETGHRNYQHPLRTGNQFGPDLDNFSLWVVYVSLVALSLDPSLWQQTKACEENLLFRKEDFEKPTASAAFHLLEQHQDARLKNLATLFEPLLALPPEQIPELQNPAGAQTPMHAAVDWVKDHLSGGQKANAARKPAPVPALTATANPSWVLDHIASNTTTKAFRGPLAPPRLAVASGLTIATYLLFPHHGGSTGLLVKSAEVGGDFLLACLAVIAGYLNDPTQRERRPLQAQHRAEIRALAKLEQERKTQEGLLESLREEGKKLQETHSRERAELKQLEAEEHAKIQARQKQRREAVEAKIQALERPLKKVRAEIAAQISQSTQQIRQIQQDETTEQADILRQLQQQHIPDILSRQRIASAGIPGIGKLIVWQLARSGYTTAEDIDANIQNVYGIGGAKANALLDWRKQMEKEAQASLPKSLPPATTATIKAKYDKQRRTLLDRLEQESRRLKQQEKSLQEKTQGALQTLENEVKTIQADEKQERDDLIRHFSQALEGAEQKEKEQAQEFAQKRKAIEEAIAQIRSRMVTQNWQATRTQRSLEAFETVTFPAYLQRLFRLKRS